MSFAPDNFSLLQLLSGFRYTHRSRIRVTVLNRKPETRSGCILALNEVFVGEDEAAKVALDQYHYQDPCFDAVNRFEGLHVFNIN